MTPARSLEKLYHSADYRLGRLEILRKTLPSAGSIGGERLIAYIVIEALNLWANFNRAFYLSCALLRPKTMSGITVAPSSTVFANSRDALLFAIGQLKPPVVFNRASASVSISPRDEPVWFDKSTLSKLNQLLSFTNTGSILKAMSYPTRFDLDLPPLRNFYAHRNVHTSATVIGVAAQQYMLNVIRPSHLLLSLMPGQPYTVLEDWLIDMRLVALELCS